MATTADQLEIKIDVIQNLEPLFRNINKILDTTLRKTKLVTREFNKIQKNTLAARKNIPISKISEKSIQPLQKAMPKISPMPTPRARGGMDMGMGGVASLMGTLGALAFPISKAKKYETAMVDVSRAVDMTAEQQELLQKQFMEMKGASLGSLAEIAAGLGRAGVAYEQIAGVTQIVSKGVLALGMNAEMTTDSIAAITNLNAWEMTAEKVAEIGDLFAHMENTTAKVKAADLANVWSRIASSLKVGGIATAESQAGIAAWAASMQRSPELAGSMVNQFLEVLPIASAKFNKLTGEQTDFYGELKTKGTGAFIAIINKIKEAGLSQLNLQKVLGTAGGLDMFYKLSDPKGQEAFLKAIKNAQSATGAMDREFSKYLATFQAKWDTLKKQFFNISATIGTTFMQMATPIIAFLGRLFSLVWRGSKAFPMLTKFIFGTAGAFLALIASIAALKLAVSGVSRGYAIFINTLQATKSAFFMSISLFKKAVFWSHSFLLRLRRLAITLTVSFAKGVWYAILSLKTFVKTMWQAVIASMRFGLTIIRSPLRFLASGFMLAVKAIRSVIIAMKALTFQYIKQGIIAVATSPTTQMVIGIMIVIGLLGLLLSKWKVLMRFMVDSYNAYIAPMIALFYDGFMWVFSKITQFFMGFINTISDGINWVLEKLGVDFKVGAFDTSGVGAAIEREIGKRSFKLSADQVSGLVNFGDNVLDWTKGVIDSATSAGKELLMGKDELQPINIEKLKGIETLDKGMKKPVVEHVIKHAEQPELKIEADFKLKDMAMQAIKTKTRRADVVKIRTVEV